MKIKLNKQSIIIVTIIFIFCIIVLFNIQSPFSTSRITSNDSTQKSNINWNFDESTETLRFTGTGAIQSYSIGSERPWKSIEQKIKHITISDGITAIGESTFFNTPNVETISIPSSVTSIARRAFGQCSHLHTFKVNKNNKHYYSEKGVLYSYNEKMLVAFPIGIQETKFSIPKNVEKIGNFAFESNQLIDIVIGNHVKEIGIYAFASSVKLKSIVFKKGLVSIGKYAFAWSKSLTKISISKTVEVIGRNAFYSCENLQKVELGKSLTILESELFRGCTSLNEISFGKNIKEIQFGVFRGCKSLTEIKIPKSVESIGMNAFKDCEKLSVIKLGKKITQIASETFSGCISLNTIVWEKYLTTIGEKAFENCHSLKSIELHKPIKYIGDKAFSNCNTLEKVVIGNEISHIGSEAFSNCPQLNEVSFGQKIQSIGETIFKGSENIQSIVIQGKKQPEKCENLFDKKQSSSLIVKVRKSYSKSVYCGVTITDFV